MLDFFVTLSNRNGREMVVSGRGGGAHIAGLANEFSCLRDGVDLFGGFVSSDAGDAWKAESEARIVARAFADRVESDFKDDKRFNLDPVASLGDGAGKELVGECRNIQISKACVGFADDSERAGFIVSDGEGIVAEDAVAFPVAIFRMSHHDIECGKAFFEFDPSESSTTRLVWTGWVFDHQALVTALSDLMETGVDLLRTGGLQNFRMSHWGGEDQLMKCLTAIGERGLQLALAIELQEVKDHAYDRYVASEKKIGFLATETFLKVVKWQWSAIAPGDNFRIKDDLSVHGGSGQGYFWEC